jgi:hypothetical protein
MPSLHLIHGLWRILRFSVALDQWKSLKNPHQFRKDCLSRFASSRLKWRSGNSDAIKLPLTVNPMYRGSQIGQAVERISPYVESHSPSRLKETCLKDLPETFSSLFSIICDFSRYRSSVWQDVWGTSNFSVCSSYSKSEKRRFINNSTASPKVKRMLNHDAAVF